MKVEVRSCCVRGYVASKHLKSPRNGVAPMERLKLTRQMAAAVGKKSTTSLSLFVEACGLEVEAQYWAEGGWI